MSAKGVFETRSVLQITLLCMVTFGVYVIYRLYRLTRQANPHSQIPISGTFMFAAIAVHLIALFSLIYYFAVAAEPQLLIFSKCMHAVSSLFHLVWLIQLGKRINAIHNAKKGSDQWLSPLYTALLHVMYIQHKINQMADMDSGGGQQAAV